MKHVIATRTYKSVRINTLLFIGTALLSTAVLADTVNLLAEKDNTLYEDDEGDLSNGAGDNLFTVADDLCARVGCDIPAGVANRGGAERIVDHPVECNIKRCGVPVFDRDLRASRIGGDVVDRNKIGQNRISDFGHDIRTQLIGSGGGPTEHVDVVDLQMLCGMIRDLDEIKPGQELDGGDPGDGCNGRDIV